MTLLEDIQGVFERTYAATGLRLQECVIGPQRFAVLSALAGAYSRELNDAGRTFLRLHDGNLLVAVYYSTPLVEHLERENPRQALGDHNIGPLIVFIEEIAHALHAALRFLEGHRDIAREEFSRDLELQGKVDTYLVLQWLIASLRGTRRLPPEDRAWVREHLFDAERFDYADANLAERYREANHLGAAYTRYLDALPVAERVPEVRGFRSLPYDQKAERIAALPGGG